MFDGVRTSGVPHPVSVRSVRRGDLKLYGVPETLKRHHIGPVTSNPWYRSLFFLFFNTERGSSRYPNYYTQL